MSNSINRVEREIRSFMEDKVGVESGWGWNTFIIYRTGSNTPKTCLLQHCIMALH